MSTTHTGARAARAVPQAKAHHIQQKSSRKQSLAKWTFHSTLLLCLIVSSACASTSRPTRDEIAARSEAGFRDLAAAEKAMGNEGEGVVATSFPGGIRVKAGDVWSAPDQSLHLEIVAVVPSSQCPPNVQCVWAGKPAQVILQAEGRGAWESAGKKELRLVEGEVDTFAGWILEAASITPPTAVLVLSQEEKRAGGK